MSPTYFSADGPLGPLQGGAPPRGVLGGLVPWQLRLLTGRHAALTAFAFRSYRSGVAFALELWASGIGETWSPVDSRHRPRLLVEFADGRRLEMGETSVAPTLGLSSIVTASDRVTLWLWLEPLPPPGSLSFAARWDSFELSENVVIADANELISAAAFEVRLLADAMTNDGSGSASGIASSWRKGAEDA